MKKNIVWSLLLVLLVGGGLLAKETMIVKVKVQAANVRSEPDAASQIIARVTTGTELEVVSKSGAWYEVTVNDPAAKAVNGYIHNSVVEVMGDNEAREEEKPSTVSTRQVPRDTVTKEFASGGVKLMGGLSMGNLNLSETLPSTTKKTSKMGFMGGLGFESGGQIGFELDLLYSPGGAVLKSTDAANKSKIEISGNAITLPIMLKVRFMKGTTPYILAGGEVGYILSQKAIVTAGDGTTAEEDITDNINRILYGLVLGGGVEMQTGGMNLLLEARYRLGLSNQIKNPDAGEYLKATSLSFLVGIKF